MYHETLRDFSFVTDTTVTLTTRPTTTVPNAATPPLCLNGGVLVGSICNCPSGYGGSFCEQKLGKYIDFQ